MTRRHITAWLDLLDCSARLLAGMATGNGTAVWNALVDAEDARIRAGRQVEPPELSKDRPWQM